MKTVNNSYTMQNDGFCLIYCSTNESSLKSQVYARVTNPNSTSFEQGGVVTGTAGNWNTDRITIPLHKGQVVTLITKVGTEGGVMVYEYT